MGENPHETTGFARGDIVVDLDLLRERIRQLRGDLTQREFGDQIGFSQSYIADIERGRNRPSFEFLAAVVERFGVSLDWLFGINVVSSPPRQLDGGADERPFFAAIELLIEAYRRSDQETRAWMRVQLRRAFPDLIDDSRSR